MPIHQALVSSGGMTSPGNWRNSIRHRDCIPGTRKRRILESRSFAWPLPLEGDPASRLVSPTDQSSLHPVPGRHRAAQAHQPLRHRSGDTNPLLPIRPAPAHYDLFRIAAILQAYLSAGLHLGDAPWNGRRPCSCRDVVHPAGKGPATVYPEPAWNRTGHGLLFRIAAFSPRRGVMPSSFGNMTFSSHAIERDRR